MSSLLVCVQPEGRSVFFAESGRVRISRQLSAQPKLAGVVPASRLAVRPLPEMVSSGIGEIDALTGGLPRGCLSEIYGPASSGRTSVLLAALAAATRREEVCALVDASDAFDPESAAAAGVDFQKLLWVWCGHDSGEKDGRNHERVGHDFSRAEKSLTKKGALAPETSNVERALRVADLLLQSGGFGLVALDFNDVPFAAACRIPLTTWFRFRRAVEHTPTVLLIVAQAPCTQTCASLLVRLRSSVVSLQSPGNQMSDLSSQFSAQKSLPAHTQLLQGLRVQGEIQRSRLERKPAQSATTAFTTKAVRAG
jgi:hypothetical protein